MSPDEGSNKPKLGEQIRDIATRMLRLPPGQLARLRHMRTDGPGALAFWDIATRYQFRTDDKGLAQIRLMASLAPKGEPGNRLPFHDLKRPLGSVLAETGYSEERLARFLELPVYARQEALDRMARFIISRDGLPVDCHDFACLLFFDDVRHTRKLASDYYRTHHKLQTEEAAR